MTVSTEKHEIMITLIRNSCNQLIDWAQKEEYGMFEWFFNIIKKDSENIYNRTISNELNDEYKINCKKIENIYVFISDLIHNLKDIVEKPLDEIFWTYSKCITNVELNANETC